MNQKRRYENRQDLTLIKEEYGFVYYRREVPSEEQTVIESQADPVIQTGNH